MNSSNAPSLMDADAPCVYRTQEYPVANRICCQQSNRPIRTIIVDSDLSFREAAGIQVSTVECSSSLLYNDEYSQNGPFDANACPLIFLFLQSLRSFSRHISRRPGYREGEVVFGQAGLSRYAVGWESAVTRSVSIS